MSNSIFSKRKNHDINVLKESNFKLNLDDIDYNIIIVQFLGPKESLYKNGIWDIRIELPKEYPYKSPSIGFLNKIYHPNVDFRSGTICLDVINETWSPMYNLFNIIDIFLPQLLLYPNPDDPLNIKASDEMINNMELFISNVDENINKFAKSESNINYN